MSEQLAQYPTNHVVGIAADETIVDACRDAVDGTELTSPSVEVLAPEDRDQVITPPESDVDPLLRRVRKLFGDETPHLESLATALRNGAYVVTVELPDPDDVGDEPHAAGKQLIGDALRDAGAADITYFGRWQVEQLAQRA